MTRVAPLPGLRHVFTHFVLHLAPERVEVAAGDGVRDADGLDWWPLDALADAALPSPVRKVLEALHRATG